ncbi:DUF721 domain-containing protein [Mangrovimonas spongiae]|uniref:DUF721 domain-containing protein n=1 Tax=Mangrovimonas spongiae TaxID=2494697 RepID=A0A3R9MFK4_9FLAO|nr:DUF721 domain-containing protein [Mangrovimonas spongiae]RSK39248.1 DUF721 domain-containing protein [Mangrovimonas spongiae]
MSKRHTEHLSLSEVLKEFVETNNLESGLDKVNIKNVWHDMMGPGISNYTTAISLKQDVLYISLSSSVLREELSYGKEKIVTMLNENLGKDLIKKVILK